MRTLISLCVLVCSSSLFAASVEELTWMKGRWAGPYGPGTLEETWNDPRGDTMVAVVRMTAPDGTNMVELVIINEEDNTLVLRLQQFSPTYEPLSSSPQTLHMSAQGDRTITFKATGDGGLSELKYTRVDDAEFAIEGVSAEGKFAVSLKAVTE